MVNFTEFSQSVVWTIPRVELLHASLVLVAVDVWAHHLFKFLLRLILTFEEHLVKVFLTQLESVLRVDIERLVLLLAPTT